LVIYLFMWKVRTNVLRIFCVQSAVQSLICATWWLRLWLLMAVLSCTDSRSSLHVALVVILWLHHAISLLKCRKNIRLLINTVLSSPRNSCKLIHRNRIESWLGLVDWIHHKLIDMTIDWQLMSTVLRIHSILVEILVRLVGLIEWFLIILVLLWMILLGADDA